MSFCKPLAGLFPLAVCFVSECERKQIWHTETLYANFGDLKKGGKHSLSHCCVDVRNPSGPEKSSFAQRGESRELAWQRKTNLT